MYDVSTLENRGSLVAPHYSTSGDLISRRDYHQHQLPTNEKTALSLTMEAAGNDPSQLRQDLS